MKKIYKRFASLGLVLIMLFSITINAFAASNNKYVEGNSERIIITFNLVKGSTYEVRIQNNRDKAIENWVLSFKTNFGLSNACDVDFIVSNNNTYSFSDPDNRVIHPGESFSFTVKSDKKKNSEIHNVTLKYSEVDGDELPDIAMDVSMLEPHEGEDFYFLDQKLSVLKGKLSHSEKVIEFLYSIEDANTNILMSGTVDISEQWKIENIGFGCGVNILTLTAKTFNGEEVDKTYTIINSNSDNFENVGIDDKTDTDQDSLPDYYEIKLGIDPNSADTDGDGLPDEVELLILGYSPLEKDSDGDGIEDPDEDCDSDNISNIQEYQSGTDLCNEDSDGDGLRDDEELLKYHTDCLNADTDGDSVNDGVEISIGTDPLVANSNFGCVFNYSGDEETKVFPSIQIDGLTADQVNDFGIYPMTTGLLSDECIPGYVDNAYSFSEIGEFGKAVLSFELAEELFTGDDFVPAIYWFNEEAQLLEKLENQKIEGNVVSAEISHFSKYIVLNSVKQDKCWTYTFLYDENENDSFSGIDIVFMRKFTRYCVCKNVF